VVSERRDSATAGSAGGRRGFVAARRAGGASDTAV
jgi:hypothetical protein